MAFVFDIQIKGITSTPVWRRLVVPQKYTFEQFHKAIQSAFGWSNAHLYEFKDKEYKCTIKIGMPSKEDAFWGKKVIDARKAYLSDFFPQTLDKLLYVYNFRQNWIHEIALSGMQEGNTDHAFCIESRGQCPSGEYGGIWGYNEMRSGIWDDDF